MSAPTMTICEQANHLDRMLFCLAEHLAGHEPVSTRTTAENAQKRPVDGATGEGRLPHAPEARRAPEGRGSF